MSSLEDIGYNLHMLKRMRIKNLRSIVSTILVVMLVSITFVMYPIQAETGKGDDVFRVIMTIFGVERSKGDVVAIVTTNNGEASRVKFLDSQAPYVIPINSSGIGGGHLVEYVATFPNVTVNAGEEYKACVVTTKDLEPICKIGNNSPASRPEFIDISLNATSVAQQETTEEASDENDEESEG
jgi:hypothetical protein